MGSLRIFALLILGVISSLATVGADEFPAATATIVDVLSNQKLILAELASVKAQLVTMSAQQCSERGSHEDVPKGKGLSINDATFGLLNRPNPPPPITFGHFLAYPPPPPKVTNSK